MKILHLSDLHLGKRVNEFSMIYDQECILREILGLIDRNLPDAVVIAGDIYDKSVPPAEAVRLFDFFLNELVARKLEIFIIYGNHDSPERIAFAGRLLEKSGVHISPVYSGHIDPVVLEDEYGPLSFWMLPYLKPSSVRTVLEDENILSYTDACAAVVSNMKIDSSTRNILVCHQFVTGALRSGSEDISVGGADNVDVSVFEKFDYVALGHLHGSQRAGRETVRYSGSPLKYSLSEINQKKSALLVEMRTKGEISINEFPLEPVHDMRMIRGSYSELALKKNYENTKTDDYLHIVLTDEDDIPDAIGRLRSIYPNIMKLEYDNSRTRHSAVEIGGANTSMQSPYELFSEFYEKQNGMQLSDEQSKLLTSLIEKIW